MKFCDVAKKPCIIIVEKKEISIFLHRAWFAYISSYVYIVVAVEWSHRSISTYVVRLEAKKNSSLTTAQFSEQFIQFGDSV